MSKFKELIDSLGIAEEEPRVKKEKKQTRITDMMYPKEDYNFMSDLLTLPETKNKFKYLLVVVDVASREFDIEPLKTKKPDEVLKAYKKMIKRKYINLAKASIKTDGGGEFKGAFDKFLKQNKIIHLKSRPGRHSQMSSVERLNRTLGRILNGFMKKKEEETDEVFREWNNTKLLNTIRKELNKYRKRPGLVPDNKLAGVPEYKIVKPKFKKGDFVKYRLDVPENSFGQKLHGGFREGDKKFSTETRRVIAVMPTAGDIPVRYALSYMPNVSFTEKQLIKSKDPYETFKVEKIIRHTKTKYEVKWKGFKQTSLENKAAIKKAAPRIVEQYEKSIK